MKIIEIIWVLKKTRYIVETIFDIIIIYINYDVAIDIAKQTTLIIIFIDKLNFRLIRTFDYIQRFNLDIKHKLEKQYMMSNVLFKFVNDNTNSLVKNVDENEFDALFTIFLIEINSKFKQRIINEYKSNLNWQRICHFLKFNDNKNVVKLLFYREKNELIFRFDNFTIENHAYNSRRFCIFYIVIQNIIQLIYDEIEYINYVKCFEQIASSWYIRELSCYLREYLKHCFYCQIYQIKKHIFYDFLQSILTFVVSFHTITMNFILILFKSQQNLNIVMTISCKFFKRVTIIVEKIT